MPEGKRKNETWQSYAERLIEEGQAEGKFDNIEGFGKPIPGIDDHHADDMWRVRKKLKEENLPFLPPKSRVNRSCFFVYVPFSNSAINLDFTH